MNHIVIKCFNNESVPVSQEVITIGVPFPQGCLFVPENLHLVDTQNVAITLQTEVLTRWSDDSCKWVLCDFICELNRCGENEFFLSLSDEKNTVEPEFTLNDKSEDWLIDNGNIRCVVNRLNTKALGSVCTSSNNKPILDYADLILRDENGKLCSSRLKSSSVERSGPVRKTLVLQGCFDTSDGRVVDFNMRTHIFAQLGKIKLELSLCNPSAATHPGNLWDLGDPGSVLLKEWSLKLVPSIEGRGKILVESTEPWVPLKESGGYIYQESSGGENWDSPNHRDRSGIVPMHQKGWVLGSEGNLIQIGERVQPVLSYSDKQDSISISVKDFWQRFPKLLSCTAKDLTIGLLPGEFPVLHELQGGEQISETVWVDFNSSKPEICGTRNVQVRCESAAYIDAQVFPENLWMPHNKQYRQLLDLALSKEKGFKTKREMIDEYGWRNYGELYADHESAFHEGSEPFISHYNNQYDPLYSFYRLFLVGHSLEWGQLADDLSAHISDIDINHTDNDREEYCHGLFWHTDHYLDAGLSTHRMASREHLDKKNPAFCGGGPAAEHCYSGGLSLNYLLTGDQRKRQQVLAMADWCWISLHGPQTIGAVLLRSIKNLKKLVSLNGTLWPLYPFTRGTGNCLNATLDAFDITGDTVYLERATKLVQGTIQPSDNPNERDLLNAEICWSYTVFLSALSRYLYVKKNCDQIDEHFFNARKSLHTFARWMVENEHPYLEKSENLEYPNETWVAQDLRKACVLGYAAKYSTCLCDVALFRQNSEKFLTYGLTELYKQQTSHYTRPLALMIQNGWFIEAVQQEVELIVQEIIPIPSKTPRFTFFEYIKRFISDLAMVLPQTGLQRELRWLRSRISMN